MKRIALLSSLAALALLAGACGNDDGADVRNIGGSGSASGSGSGSASQVASGSGSGSAVACETSGSASHATGEVHLVLDEWSIQMEEDAVPEGHVKIEASNEGDEAHEVVVVRADSIEDLPTDADGALDESALASDALLGEIPPIGSGEDCEGVFELEAGSYVFLCNVVEDGKSHLAEGMALEVSI